MSEDAEIYFTDNSTPRGILNEIEFIFENHPDDVSKEYGLSLINVLLGNYDDALCYLRSAIKKKPNHSALNRHLAEILIYRKDYQKAIQHLEKAYENDRGDFKSYALLIMLYYRIGEHEQATKGLNNLARIITRLEVSVI